ncbi:NERD domain-containing protein [Chloroflexota bacterium]
MDIFRPHIKGWLGEVKTQISQKVFFDSKVYSTFTNFIIKDESGSTQIDHITVSRYGIFVVETKDWSGWIYGNERVDKWTQNIFGNKTQLQNPLRQNYRHTMSLSKYLNIAHEKIKPIVMVWGDCEFKTKMPRNVIRGGIQGDTDYIKSFSEVLFTDEEILNICNKLKSGKAEMNLLSGWHHVQSLKQQREHKSDTVCPKCGGRLVERNGKQGLFIGKDRH